MPDTTPIDDPIEAGYYSKTKASWFEPANLCGCCANSMGHDGVVDEKLQVQWHTVLPLCEACRDAGALPLVRLARRNGAANAQKAAKDDARQKRATDDVASSDVEDSDEMKGIKRTRANAPAAKGSADGGKRSGSQKSSKASHRGSKAPGH